MSTPEPKAMAPGTGATASSSWIAPGCLTTSEAPVQKTHRRSRRRGIRTLVGDVLFSNEQMLDVLRHLGLPYAVTVDAGIAEITLDLADMELTEGAQLRFI